MQDVIVLGGGSAGTLVANRLRERLAADAWRITVVDAQEEHHYKPGYLFVPFGTYDRDDVVRPARRLLAGGVQAVQGEVASVDPEGHQVTLADGRTLSYDRLVIATGAQLRPDLTPGMQGPGWREDVHEFYSLEGAEALRDALDRFEGGRLVVHVCELPITCPVAPLEFAFLADAYFRERGLRDRVEIVYATPLDAAFTTPEAAARLGELLVRKGIALEPDVVVESIDQDAREVRTFDDRVVAYDLLVTVPVHAGAEGLTGSGLVDHAGFVEVDPGTLQAKAHPDVFALGDAADLPIAKSGSAAHHAAGVLVDNLVAHAHDRSLPARYDGQVECFVETGDDQAVLLAYDYATPPKPGRFPLPGIGPFTLLEESPMNHAGKMLFKWSYWHLLLRGHELPLPGVRPADASEVAA
jgi:sulfide:quinone oxidoreductase